MNAIGIQSVLLARRYLYQLCQRVFGEDPTSDILDAVFSQTTEECMSMFRGVEHTAYEEALDEWSRQKDTYLRDKEAFLLLAKSDYTKQFIGPHELKAPPWECVYRTKERILFQEETLAVRQAYRAENMLPADYPHVPDDFIAIELDFMAKLAKKTEDSFEVNQYDECARLLLSQESFLEDHLLAWIPEYAEDLIAAAPTSFYAATAALCSSFLMIDSQLTKELVSYMKDQKNELV